MKKYNDLSETTFNTLMNKITKATTLNSWKWLDGSEENHVFTAKNHSGQSWFYTAIYDDFGMAEKPSCEIIELGRETPGISSFASILMIIRDNTGIRIVKDDHNLKVKLEKA